MKFLASFVALMALPLLMVSAQKGPGSVACDTCLGACKANPSGVSQDCVDACNKNLDCQATITTSTAVIPTATAQPTPSSAAYGNFAYLQPLSLLGAVGVAMGMM